MTNFADNFDMKPGVMLVIVAICCSFTGIAYGQNSIELNLNVSSEINSGYHSPNLQTELELAYKNQLYHVKNDLYLFGMVAGFFQPDFLSQNNTP